MKWYVSAPLLLAIAASGLFPTTQSLARPVIRSAITRTRDVGGYRLVLKIEAPSILTTNPRAKRGQVMISGKMYHCAMKTRNSRLPADSVQKCNHLVELHIHRVRTGKVLKHAQVWIRMQRVNGHANVWVPIMKMFGVRKGPKDLYYGNDVYAPHGRYVVHATVNGTRTTFAQFGI